MSFFTSFTVDGAVACDVCEACLLGGEGLLKSRENKSSVVDAGRGALETVEDGGELDRRSEDIDKSSRAFLLWGSSVCCIGLIVILLDGVLGTGVGEGTEGTEVSSVPVAIACGLESRMVGSCGGGPSKAHRLLSYFDWMKDSSL